MILSKDVYYNAEIWTLILHFVSLLFLLVLFARWLPFKHRHKSFSAEWAERKRFVLADLLCGGTFLILLSLSVALILFPTNSFSIHAATERVSGQIEQMERRHYIWAPSYSLNHNEYTGTYLRIDGEEYYCAVNDELLIGNSIDLLHAEGSDYVTRYTILDSSVNAPTPLSRPLWEHIAWFALLGTGLYVMVRSLYFIGIYTMAYLNRTGKNPLSRFFKK